MQAAERTITADLEALIAKTVDPAKANYAVIAGVQVHSWPAKGESGPTLEYVSHPLLLQLRLLLLLLSLSGHPDCPLTAL